MLVQRILVRLSGLQESLPGVLQGLPRLLVSGLVILLAVLLRGSAVRVGRQVMQLSGALMIVLV